MGIGLLGLSIMFLLVRIGYGDSDTTTQLIYASETLSGFGFGASSIALFARVAGGIYTKGEFRRRNVACRFKQLLNSNSAKYVVAADVGADLVGKIQLEIPEDDPRNPAVIADLGKSIREQPVLHIVVTWLRASGNGVARYTNAKSDFEAAVRICRILLPNCLLAFDSKRANLPSLSTVGDNVGDVAGMGADLFESYVGSIIAALTLAAGDPTLSMLPFWISGAGTIASVLAYFAVRTKDDASQKQLLFALEKGVIVSSAFVLIFSAIIVFFLFDGREEEGWRIYGCIVVGLVAGVLIGWTTEYFTSYSYYPTRSITNAGVTGPATVIIQGLGIGMISCVFPVLIIVGTILICNALSSQYGVAISAVGMLSSLGINLAADSYGPISDNAGGIAEMAGCDEGVRNITDQLDALGNTTAATGKGFAIGSAVLTALSFLAAFKQKAGVDAADISDPVVLSGMLIGAMLPFLFSALTMLSVQKVSTLHYRIPFVP